MSARSAVRILVICPAPKGSRLGNRVTALRWKTILGALGHRVTITDGADQPAAFDRFDVVVALHARKSSADVLRARMDSETRPIVVVLTGTDLYRDVSVDASARRSLALADRLVVLHDGGERAIPREFRHKTRVVPQSAERTKGRRARSHAHFDVVVVGHLRDEKDPLRTALAARALASSSRVRVLHAGRALTEAMATAAEREMQLNARYRWLGELSPKRTRTLISRAHLLVLTSRIEGGANVLSEAIVDDVPVLASCIPSTVGILGRDHPGLFPVGDTRALTRAIARAERDPVYLARLIAEGRARRKMVSPARERGALRSLFGELAHPRARSSSKR